MSSGEQVSSSADSSDERLTLCIRLIRSFEYRNIKTIVLRDVSSSIRVRDLIDRIVSEIQKSALPPPFKKHQYDCLKIHSYAHGAKTNDTAINLDHDDWILSPDRTLTESLIRDETEISFFLKKDYDKYKLNPQLLWGLKVWFMSTYVHSTLCILDTMVPQPLSTIEDVSTVVKSFGTKSNVYYKT